MSLDYETLNGLRSNHPAWQLLRADNAAFIIAFLQRAFLIPNRRVMAQGDLIAALEDELFVLRDRLGPQAYPKEAAAYLNDWAAPERRWLRKFYPDGSDDPHFDLTPPTEKAIEWLGTLSQRSFVGTESRLLTLFGLLKQVSEGSDADPAARIAALEKRRDDIDAEIARIRRGDIPLLDDTAIKDRFQQITQLARELLADFREVEQNFRNLDRDVRERIALWDGARAELLEEILGARDAITDSDQGRSFRAFWDFLMSSERQAEFSALLQHILGLAPVMALAPSPRFRRIHYDWLEAGELTQRMVAQLSQQLRRFLDDKAWLENRRIMEILHQVEARALALRNGAAPELGMSIPGIAADIELPMERPLYAPSIKPRIANLTVQMAATEIDASALYGQIIVDKARLAENIRFALRSRAQVNLAELCRMQPLKHGLAELVAYLQLASGEFTALVDEAQEDVIDWERVEPSGVARVRQARLPRVIYLA